MIERIEKRYIRNIPAISEDEQRALWTKKVAVIGCGGLGGFVIEYLARLGIGQITVVDDDIFDQSNLNRQMLSSVSRVGKRKVIQAKTRVLEINPDIVVRAVEAYIGSNNAAEIVSGHDLIIDALDNVKSRLILEDGAAKEGITIVHGAIQGWNMQVTVARPGKNVLHSLYKSYGDENNDIAAKTCLVMTPACCAAIQTAEAVKILTGKEPDLDGRVLMFDLKDMSSIEFEIGE